MAGKIFISYRRDDDPSAAARVRDGLVAKFGKSNVFMDVDNLMAGQRFDAELAKALASCDLLVGIIGKHWQELLKAKEAEGERDYVREEIAAALERKISVIPVRVGRDGALPPLPRSADLPGDIRDLVQFQKHDVAHEHFGRDLAALVTAIISMRRAGAQRGTGAQLGLPLRRLGQIAVALLLVGWIGAHLSGLPVWWPGGGSQRVVLSHQANSADTATTELGASRTADDADFEHAINSNTIAALGSYLSSHRDGRHLAAVRSAIAAIQAADVEANKQRADNDAFLLAKSRNSIAELRAYLLAHPASQHAAEGQNLLETMQQAEEAERQRRTEAEALRRNPASGVIPGSANVFRDEGCPGGCPEMVVVPSGKFLMGAGQGEIEAVTKDDPAGTERWRSNAPQISVVIAKAFAVGQTHVTRVQFKAFVDANSGYRIDSGCYSYEARQWRLSTNRSWRDPGYSVTDEQPVVCVNWNDAKAYAEWLSKVTGHGYRLLSDAETEYVTRAPKSEDPRQPRYFFGDDAKDLCAYANGADTTAADKFNWSATDIAACPDNFVFTAPVASFKPNRWGLYDVHGNVWTWTEDCWNDSNSGNGGDGTARATGDCSRHVIRGGSWYGNPRDLRAANRDGGSSENRVSFLGFRLAMTLNP